MAVSTGPSTRTKRLLDLTKESTPMGLFLRDQLSTARSMVLERTLSPLELCGKETSKMIFYKEMVTKLLQVRELKLSSRITRLKRLLKRLLLLARRADLRLLLVGMKVT